MAMTQMKILNRSLKGWAGKQDLNGECSKYLLINADFRKDPPLSYPVFHILRSKFTPMSVLTDGEYVSLGCLALPLKKL